MFNLEFLWGTIETFKVDNNNDSGKIFHQIIHYLLTNTPESLWFEKVYSALEGVDNKVLANTVKSTYMKTSLTGKSYLFSQPFQNSAIPMCIYFPMYTTFTPIHSFSAEIIIIIANLMF